MQKRVNFPKRPVRATLITFIALSIYVGAFIPFVEQIRDAWPLAFGYCAFLAISVIGLIRLGLRALLLIGIPAAVATSIGAIGLWLTLHPGGSLDSGGVWIQISSYLLHAVLAIVLYLTIMGWHQYFSEQDQTG